MGHAAARAALRYGVAQGWIIDETTRGSVNIQEVVDRVVHTRQTEVALHTRGRHGGPAEGIIVEPMGMVLVLAADMIQGVLNPSRERRARLQWTIQEYTPSRTWPFCTWAVLAIMWHLAPEGTPTVAPHFHVWPADQDFPWRRPQGGHPVAPAAEGLSLAATLKQHPYKKAHHFLQTGTVPAAPRDSGWRCDAGRHNRCRTPGSSRCGTCPRKPWFMPSKPSRELSHRPDPPALPFSAAYRRGWPGCGGEKRTDARASISSWCRARRCFTPRTWEPWNGGQSRPKRRANG